MLPRAETAVDDCSVLVVGPGPVPPQASLLGAVLLVLVLEELGHLDERAQVLEL